MRLQTFALWCVCIFLGFLSKTTNAQTVETLFEFGKLDRGPQGPHANVIQGSDGNFYGTTYGGGSGEFDTGTVFKMSPAGRITMLMSFDVGSGNPGDELIEGANGIFYGTTPQGGAHGKGRIFRITSEGEFSTIHSFDGSNGERPSGGLIRALDGNFYGVTSDGGANGIGVVFRMTPAESVTTLVSFDLSIGSNPVAGLLQGANGDFYGTTSSGGTNNAGSVFQVTSAGNLTRIASLGGNHGSQPMGRLVQAQNGDLYGTTFYGGMHGLGTIFKVADGHLTTLISFNGTNGAKPSAGLTWGTDGTAYGTTQEGGANGRGTVFKLTELGELVTLVTFNDHNGANPYASLRQAADGSFYGTTEYGGVGRAGAVFRMTASGDIALTGSFQSRGSTSFAKLLEATDGQLYGTLGSGDYNSGIYGAVYQLSADNYVNVLASFTITNGMGPYGGVIQGSDGAFYGTVSQGASNHGTIFKLSPEGELNTLVYFQGTNGSQPYAGLIQATDGHFYGTTKWGGNNNQGTIFKMTPAGDLTTLHHCSWESGAYPNAELLEGTDGYLYGTTELGGPGECGTVFKISTNGVFTRLVAFDGANGGAPSGPVIQAADGNLYGTTLDGGGGEGCGTVFKLTLQGEFSMLTPIVREVGCAPFDGLVQGTDGNLYGTTIYGGAHNYGSIFRVTLDGEITRLFSFAKTNGAHPHAALIQAQDGKFYGTTFEGGLSNEGIIFRLTLNEKPSDLLLDTTSVEEGLSAGAIVGSFTAVDVDLTDSHHFELVAGEGDSGNAAFEIDGNQLKSAVVFDYETKGNYSIRVRLTDSFGLSLEKIFVISVTDANDAPSGMLLTNEFVYENQAPLTTVGLLSAVDHDELTAHAFSFAAGEGDGDNASFAIEGNALKIIGVANYAVKSSYSVRIRATDSGGLFFEKAFVILVRPAISITAQPLSQSVTVGGNAALSVFVNGDAPTFQWRKNGNPIPGATASSLLFNNFQASDAARYDVVVANPAGTETSESAWLFASGAEVNIPVVKVLSPVANQRITNSLALTMTGSTTDSGLGVAQVFYKLNGGVFQLAEGTAEWTANLILNAGLNTVEVKAIDFAGNQSKVVKVSFTAVIYSPLTLEVNGFGDLVATSTQWGTPTNGALLEIGRNYTITAVPAASNLFSNWSGTVSSSNAKLTFAMQSNLVLTANFVTNSFIGASGTYSGLFSSASGVTFESAGYVTIKITPKLTCSGKIFVNGNAVAFSGKMNLDGTMTLMTKSRMRSTDKPELSVSLALDFENETEALTGTISQGGTGAWSSDLWANRSVWTTNIVQQATAFTNSYTMLIPGFDSGTEGPAGSGYGSVRLDKLGKIKLSGAVADGQPLKQATVVSKSGWWPMFSPVYYSKRTNNLLKLINEADGFVMGWLRYTNNQQGHMAPHGEVIWIKSGWTNSTYVNGFTNVTEIHGSRWLAPVPKSGDRAIQMTNALVTLSGGDLDEPFSGTFFVTTNTTFALISGSVSENYPNSLRAGITARTGLIKGAFVHPVNSLSTKFYGAMLQDQNFGSGFFMGPNAGGLVEVVPADE